jgi:hypothetical protein
MRWEPGCKKVCRREDGIVYTEVFNSNRVYRPSLYARDGTNMMWWSGC